MLIKIASFVPMQVCVATIIYSKNNKGPYADPWGTPQLVILVSRNILSDETKEALLER